MTDISDDDLLMSILAMDVYNRSSNQGIFVPGDDLTGTYIGNAKIIRVSHAEDNDHHSFHAIAYQLEDGRIVIDYRGTDNLNFSNLQTAQTNDLFNGWLVGGGLTVNNQAGLAVQFYQDVLNQLATDSTSTAEDRAKYANLTAFDQAPSNIVFTGHSLGGGLAGIVASLSHGEAIVTDNMPYQIAVAVMYVSEIINRLSQSETASAILGATGSTAEERFLALSAILPEAGAAVIGSAIGELIASGQMPALPDWSKVQDFHTEGEILQLLRDGRLPLLAEIFGMGSPLTILGAIYTPAFFFTNLLVKDEQLSVFGWDDKGKYPWEQAIDHHSAALAVFLEYSEKNQHDDWHSNKTTVNAVLDGLYDNSVGDIIGLTTQPKNPDGTAPTAQPGSYTGFVPTSDQMLRMIAYSALDGADPAKLPFGNTAIKAVLNDADDLGRAINDHGFFDSNATLKEFAPALGQIIAQFGGQLAYGHIMVTEDDPVIDGAMSFDQDNHLLTVDFSDTLWDHKKAGTNTDHTIVGRDTIINDLLKHEDATSRGAFHWLYGGYSYDMISHAVISTTDDSSSVSLSEPPAPEDNPQFLTLSVFSDGNDTIVGSSKADFIAGGNGNDRIFGGAGNNILAGGDGNDTLIGGEDKDVLAGGDGTDVADYGLDGAVLLTVATGLPYTDVLVGAGEPPRVCRRLVGLS